jgi:lipopolysaccharide transport system ATP-binding protein
MQIGCMPLDQRDDRTGDGSATITRLTIEDADGRAAIGCTSRLKATIAYRSERPLKAARFMLGIYDYNNTGIYLLNTDHDPSFPDELPASGEITCVTEPISLTPGRCYVNAALQKCGVSADYVAHAATFDVEPDVALGAGPTPGRDWVMCLLNQRWQTSPRRIAA